MELKVKYRPDSEEWAVTYIFNEILKLLKTSYPEIHFVYEPVTYFPHWVGTPRHGSLVIENNSNKKTIVLSYDDDPKNILVQVENTGWDVTKIQKLYCSPTVGDILKNTDFYKKISNVDVNKIVEPFYYPVYRTEFDTKYCDIVYANKKPSYLRKEALLFRGLSYGEREYVMMNCTHPEITVTNKDYKSLPEYADELAEYRCGLSFTGAAEICFRDIELMGLGMPIIRPYLSSTVFKDPLIPNKHYIPFEGYHLPEKLEGLINKWEEVKKDYYFLEEVGENARQWYLKNARLDSQAAFFVNNINLNLIIN